MYARNHALRFGFGPILLQPCRPLAVAVVIAAAVSSIKLPADPSPAAPSAPTVVTTLPVLADLVEAVGGDRLSVRSLLREEDDVHVFEPLPADLKQLRDADIVYQIGLGLEPWLDKLIQASGTSAVRVRLSDGINRITTDLPCGHSHDHADGPGDPHIWMDPIRVTFMVVGIAETLAEVAPHHSEVFFAQSDRIVADINRAHRRALEIVADIPERRRKLVTPHHNFAYFAERYNFEIIGTIMGLASTDHFDPSAHHVKTLIDRIREFSVAGEPAPMLHRIARESGVAVRGPLYCRNLKPGLSYAETLLYNVSTIRQALLEAP